MDLFNSSGYNKVLYKISCKFRYMYIFFQNCGSYSLVQTFVPILKLYLLCSFLKAIATSCLSFRDGLFFYYLDVGIVLESVN